jgi:short subunit dehydrogenase-like uncharacterized protein
MNAERMYDVIVFGATGFTGQLVAAYLAAQPQIFRWALAGRSRQKLTNLQKSLGVGEDVGVLVADSADYDTLIAMTAQSRVLLTTVGPYVKYGELLVRACVATATDYVDITGEPQFVNDIIARYDASAREQQIRIVNCCGFDSIPHDLGAYFTALQLGGDQPLTLEAYVSMNGSLSGGTWNSAIEAFGNLRTNMRQSSARSGSDPQRDVRGMRGRVHYEPIVKGWVTPMPTIDPQIVLRSARTLPQYGPRFRYGHYLRVGSLPALVGLGAGVGTAVALAQFRPTRTLLGKLRPPGEGPTPEQRARSNFRVTFVGKANGEQIITEVRGGDPGYTETAKMVAESALCLALDRDQLPARYGVLTTAVAMGDRLLARLQQAGITFSVVERTGSSR